MRVNERLAGGLSSRAKFFRRVDQLPRLGSFVIGGGTGVLAAIAGLA